MQPETILQRPTILRKGGLSLKVDRKNPARKKGEEQKREFPQLFSGSLFPPFFVAAPLKWFPKKGILFFSRVTEHLSFLELKCLECPRLAASGVHGFSDDGLRGLWAADSAAA